MNIQSDTEVRSIVMEYPSTSRVFEHFGIDYYCDSGHRSLADDCEFLLITIDEVVRAGKFHTTARKEIPRIQRCYEEL